MDDESKQLLREIRDAIVRHEAVRKRFMRIWAVVVIFAACVIGFIAWRLEGRMQAADDVDRAAIGPGGTNGR